MVLLLRVWESSSWEQLWSHLKQLEAIISFPWLMCGDFSEVVLPSEDSGGYFSTSTAEKFLDVINTCGIVGIEAEGSQFTWVRKEGGRLSIWLRDWTDSWLILLDGM